MPATSIFRQEAIDALTATAKEGAPLQLLPLWTRWTYWVLVGAVMLGLIYAGGASVAEYAEGQAVVRVEGRLDLGSTHGGVVRTVEVRAGDRVEAGQVLVRFHGAAEHKRLDQLEREFELRLARLLLHPRDEATRQALAALRAQREVVEARLEERAVIAPQAGVVASLRVRPGQMLAPGELALTLVDPRSPGYFVQALLPGEFRPLLREGMKIRFQLEGHPRVFRTLAIELVGDEVIGPAEARRYLGRELRAAGARAAAAESLVLVRARLPEATFTADGKSFSYHDGVPGRVDIRVRSTRLLAMLFSPLRGWFGHAS